MTIPLFYMVSNHCQIIMENASLSMAWILWFYSCSAKTSHSSISRKKITLLTLVDNYKTEADIFPTHKKIFFKCTTLQYSKWSIKELQRWLSTARKIIQRYKLNKKQQVRSKINSNHSTILDTNIYLPFQSITTHHTIIKAKKKKSSKGISNNKKLSILGTKTIS